MIPRRTFLKILGGASAGTLIPIPIVACSDNKKVERDKWGELLPRRDFGKTGEKVTMLGLGGFHLGRMTDKVAQETVETAIAGGIRFIDSAESYVDGESEVKIGKYITPKYRDEVYLMTKTRATDRKTAEEHLEQSRKRMDTDVIDLYLMHAVNSKEDVENRMNNEVLDVLLEAKAAGKIRHVGFSGHTTIDAHSRLLELSNEIEACMMPVNIIDPSYKSYIKNILPKLLEQKAGVIAMKTLAGGAFFGKGFDGRGEKAHNVMDEVSLQEALHFVWSLPVGVLVTGAKDAAMLQEKIDLAKSFTSMGQQAQDALIDKVAHFAGEVEYYKE